MRFDRWKKGFKNDDLFDCWNSFVSPNIKIDL